MNSCPRKKNGDAQKTGLPIKTDVNHYNYCHLNLQYKLTKEGHNINETDASGVSLNHKLSQKWYKIVSYRVTANAGTLFFYLGENFKSFVSKLFFYHTEKYFIAFSWFFANNMTSYWIYY